MRSEQGVSLVEATVILLVVSAVAAMLAPSIGDYVQDASRSRAKKDIETIGTSLKTMLTDIGETWLMQNGHGTTTTDPPSHAMINRVNLLVSANGDTPAVGVARSVAGTDWGGAVDNAAVQTLDAHLIQNTPSNLAVNRYRLPADMTLTFDPADGSQYNSEFAWRGAYLSGPIGPDPWGTRYAVNVEFLAKPPGSGNTNDVFVLCAGRNKRTETRYDTDGVTALSDDIVYVVSGGTR